MRDMLLYGRSGRYIEGYNCVAMRGELHLFLTGFGHTTRLIDGA